MKRRKVYAYVLLLVMVFNLIPQQVFALTGGPSQPEVESFKPIEVTDMVDPATGDFSYNIPLLEVGGYPINLIYNAGITMDQEASMVGLGWNINPGVINRSVRGIPDDFKGDKIEKKVNIRDNITWGFSYSAKFELFGINTKNYTGKQVSLSPSLGLNYNNYNGFGLEFGITPAFSGGDKCLPGLNASMGLTADSKEGIGFSPSVSYSKKIAETNGFSTLISNGLGTNINSRAGFKALTYNVGLSTKGYGTIKGKDENGNEASLRANSSHSFFSGSATLLNNSSISYIPKIEYPMNTHSFTFQASVAAEGMGAFAGASFTGYHSNQKLASNLFSTPSYGIAYLDKGKDKNDLLDFNREKDGSFTKEKPNLPIPFLTHDLFSVSGQGIGGSYQLFRGDVGVVHDKKAKNFSSGNSLGVEVGAGNAFRLGGDIHTNIVNSYTGKWDDYNPTLDLNVGFFSSSNVAEYESHYFKAAGEASPYLLNEENVFTATGLENAVKFSLDKSGSEVTLQPVLKSNNGNSNSISGPILRTNRSKRNQSISYLTVDEAKKFALEKRIKNYILNSESFSTFGRDTVFRKGHHISEITALRPDGLRYIYGIAAYNKEQYEISYSVDGNGDCNSGLFPYIPQNSDEITPSHKHGLDHFLDQEKTPAFAHSFLLTAILSEDFVDKTGDGPTPDDLGTYTKFNYTRIHDDYKWRIPYQDANFNPGFNSKSDDNKANFTYGTKELWLLHSIESKTQIASFHYSDRKDSHGVIGYAGGLAQNMVLKKLDKIVLYSLPDKDNNIPAQRTPIKSVHFSYDYSLCGMVPTNVGTSELVNTHDINGVILSTTDVNVNKGKLTLKKVYFKYGKSEKSQFSPYQFKYSGDLTISSVNKGINPNYHIKGYNRWGTFMHVNAKTLDLTNIICDKYNLTSSDYPFIRQVNSDAFDEKGYADNIAGAWSLREIFLPSGGLIKVEYEADDYGFVQDKEAMQLFEIIGTSKLSTEMQSFGSELSLYDSSPNNYLFFNLEKNIPTGEDPRMHVFNHYVRQVFHSGDLFFKVFAKVNDVSDYEFVQGYAEIEDWGALEDLGASGIDKGYIKLKTACTKDREVSSNGICNGPLNYEANPISKTIWQFARLYLPNLVYGNPSGNISENANDFISVGQSFKNLFSDFSTIFQGGINNKMKNKNYGKSIIKGKSWVRLNNPFWKKLAGTHRVKKIVISDEWSTMTQNQHQNSEYGQEFYYTSKDMTMNGNTFEISSGVASYEPLIGAEDNPFRLPKTYKQTNKLAPDNDLYHEGPIGESFYPGPNIVYSEVRIQNLKYQNVTKKATGHSIHKFHTAKEYPTKVSETTLDAYPKKTNPVLRILKIKNQDYMTTSQGYAIELNDMHGKEKSKAVYNETGTKISGIEYKYKSVYGSSANQVPLILSDGNISQGVIGTDYSIVVDQREARNKTKGIGVNLNNDNFFIGPIPVPAFVPLPFFSSEKIRYRSVVVNKIIHRAGILSTTIAYDLGSTVETRNLAWDGITGEVLATQTFNEFEDPIYNFTYPAHWAYKGMQNAYKNINAGYQATISGGNAFVGSGHVFTEGDEVSLDGSTKAWVKSISGNTIDLIDFYGAPIGNLTNVSIKIIRSGHRNKASTSIGSVVSLLSPIQGSGLTINGNNQIINAGAIKFDDKRNVPCCDGCTCKIHEIKNNGPAYNFLIDLINNFDFTQITNPYSSVPNDLKQYIGVGTCGIGTSTTIPYSYRKIFSNETDGLYCSIVFKTDQTNCECTIKFRVINQNLKKFTVSNIEFGKGCNRCKATFLGTQTYHQSGGYPDIQYSGEFEIYSECFQLFENCGDCTSEIEPNINNNLSNPYTTNQQGTYTPKKSYTFLAQRKSSASNTTQPDLQKDGYFTNGNGNPYFTPFWRNTGGTWSGFPNKWTWTAEVTKIHPNGNELESRDPLERYSSELLGYNDHMVIAVAGNAKYGDCMFDGFEDYRYDTGLAANNNLCRYKYFSFSDAKPKMDQAQSHSGKYFLSLNAGQSSLAQYKLYRCSRDSTNTGESPGEIVIPNDQARFKIMEHDTTPKPCDCLNEFNPQAGKYVISAWVKEGNDPLQHDYQDSKCTVGVDGNYIEFKAKGPVIEGWQRIYGEFEIPDGSKSINIALIASLTEVTGFDDIRIHPFDASFKSFVYDDITLRFTYELDENNFFTKYEYDASGKLERVKKETERGVMTVQETRFSNKKSTQ